MKWNRNLPSGTKDKLFREANGAYELEIQVNQVMKNRGYQRIETPIIEFQDVFTLGEASEEQRFYRFFDLKGRLLVLRPDMTLPIGRVIATTGILPPLKLSYSGKIFRSNDELLGEKNELTQAGIELIGFDSLKAELECITCAVAVLEQLEIPNFHFELGHAKIFQSIVKKLALEKQEIEELKIYLNHKSLSDLATFVAKHPSELDPFIQNLPKLFGDADAVLALGKSLLPENSDIVPILTELEQLRQLIKGLHPDISLTVDLGTVAIMDYYTGVLFSGYADLVADIFLRGGRYDHLVEKFGQKRVPAVGFGINLDTLVALKYKLGQLAPLSCPKTLVHAELMQQVQAEELIKKHPDYQLSLFDTLEEAKLYGEKWSYEQLIYLTDGKERLIKVGR